MCPLATGDGYKLLKRRWINEEIRIFALVHVGRVLRVVLEMEVFRPEVCVRLRECVSAPAQCTMCSFTFLTVKSFAFLE